MSPRVRNIIGWVLSGIVALMFIWGGAQSIILSPEHKAEMAKMGMTMSDETVRMTGALQLLCAILFLIPRTGVLGTMLLTAYLGGAIATHLFINKEMILVPIVFEVIVWIAALIRFPEIGWRLFRGRAD